MIKEKPIIFSAPFEEIGYEGRYKPPTEGKLSQEI